MPRLQITETHTTEYLGELVIKARRLRRELDGLTDTDKRISAHKQLDDELAMIGVVFLNYVEYEPAPDPEKLSQPLQPEPDLFNQQ